MAEKSVPSKKYKIIIALQIFALVFVLGGASLYLYDYTEYNPTFCINCHVMDKPFAKWYASVHKEINCHDCHYASVLRRNQMLIKTLLERPTDISPHPPEHVLVPSTMCIKCHWEGYKNAAKISESTGHALHWFKGSIECTSCHAIKLHEFSAEQTLCVQCHAKGRVVIEKMNDLACTDCHNFRGGGLMPKADKCLECHEERLPDKPVDGGSLAHRQFDCMTCHHTHDPGRPANQACHNCHVLTMKRGKHPLHLNVLGNDCLSCHKPHVWRIAEGDSKKLCSQCHKFYPLNKFG